MAVTSLTPFGVYQPGDYMQNAMKNKSVTAHLFEYTATFGIDPNFQFVYPDKRVVPTNEGESPEDQQAPVVLRVCISVWKPSHDPAKLIVAAYERYRVSNSLHPDKFPTIGKMEAEVVVMCSRLAALLISGNVMTLTLLSQNVQ